VSILCSNILLRSADARPYSTALCAMILTILVPVLSNGRIEVLLVGEFLMGIPWGESSLPSALAGLFTASGSRSAVASFGGASNAGLEHLLIFVARLKASSRLLLAPMLLTSPPKLCESPFSRVVSTELGCSSHRRSISELLLTMSLQSSYSYDLWCVSTLYPLRRAARRSGLLTFAPLVRSQQSTSAGSWDSLLPVVSSVVSSLAPTSGPTLSRKSFSTTPSLVLALTFERI
jgi:hypothetical protein